MYRISLLWCPWARQLGHIPLDTLWQLPCLGTISKGWPPLRFILVFKACCLRDKILSAYSRIRTAQALLYRLPVSLMHLIVFPSSSTWVLEYYTKTGNDCFSYIRFTVTFPECVVLWNKSPKGRDPPSEKHIRAYSSKECTRVFLTCVFWKRTWNAILECPIPPRHCAVAMIAFNTIMYEKKKSADSDLLLNSRNNNYSVQDNIMVYVAVRSWPVYCAHCL
jgi:hypothetical protein